MQIGLTSLPLAAAQEKDLFTRGQTLRSFSGELVSSVSCRHLSHSPWRYLTLTSGGHLILPSARSLSSITRRLLILKESTLK
ncbi:UNVERIFIED_CONTAM: hypothetical protein Sradi_3597800 [Sesamum radiatum]|uniref:Uncharacterized protein n=1 Tax=Sesamum radiatum TaxID=300843 RepID=A0AAW2QGR8_SESRA